MELSSIEEHKNALFNITSSVPVSLRVYNITFANDTDSKTAEDKQNSRITIFFMHIVLEENKNNTLDGLLTS